MNYRKAHIVSIVGSLAIGGVCAYFGSSIPFRDQWPLYEALRSTSSIIFAVIGAWLTILYPDAIKKVFIRHSKFTGEGVESIELLVSNIRYSTGILATIMLVGILGQIARHLTILQPYTEPLRAALFALLGILTFLQFWTLLMTLAQAEWAHEKLHTEADRKTKVNSFNSNVQIAKSAESAEHKDHD